MARGQRIGLRERVCRLPGCTTAFSPTQSHQRYCHPGHRFEAHRLRIAIPVAQQYLQQVLAELDETEATAP